MKALVDSFMIMRISSVVNRRALSVFSHAGILPRPPFRLAKAVVRCAGHQFRVVAAFLRQGAGGVVFGIDLLSTMKPYEGFLDDRKRSSR